MNSYMKILENFDDYEIYLLLEFLEKPESIGISVDCMINDMLSYFNVVREESCVSESGVWTSCLIDFSFFVGNIDPIDSRTVIGKGSKEFDDIMTFARMRVL